MKSKYSDLCLLANNNNTMSKKERKQVPLYPYIGSGPIHPSEIITKSTRFVDAPTGNQLPGPVYWGDTRPSGTPYHGGIIHPSRNIIAYHYQPGYTGW